MPTLTAKLGFLDRGERRSVEASFDAALLDRSEVLRVVADDGTASTITISDEHAEGLAFLLSRELNGKRAVTLLGEMAARVDELARFPESGGALALSVLRSYQKYRVPGSALAIVMSLRSDEEVAQLLRAADAVAFEEASAYLSAYLISSFLDLDPDSQLAELDARASDDEEHARACAAIKAFVDEELGKFDRAEATHVDAEGLKVTVKRVDDYITSCVRSQ